MNKKQKLSEQKKITYKKKSATAKIEKSINSSAPKTRGFGM